MVWAGLELTGPLHCASISLEFLRTCEQCKERKNNQLSQPRLGTRIILLYKLKIMLPIEEADIQNFEHVVLKLKFQPSFSSGNISYVACSWGIDYSISSIPLSFIRLQVRFPLRN